MLAGLVALTLWGAVSPRSQWRLLVGWTRNNPAAVEPGPISVGIHRVVAIAGTIVLGVCAVGAVRQPLQAIPEAVPPTSVVQQLWGSPTPHVVNRIVPPVSAPPNGLMAQPILRYQAIDGARRTPSYLFALPVWARTGVVAGEGYIGVDPPVGRSALDTASLVLQVRGDPNCIPRVVVVDESETTVAVAVYYGRPDSGSRETRLAIADCQTKLSAAASVSVLIPVPLSSLVGSRTVVRLDGTAIPKASSPR